MAEAKIIQLYPPPGGPVAPGVEPRASGRPALSVPPLESPERDEAAAQLASVISSWQQRVASAVSFARRRVSGDYLLDEFGFDSELTEVALLPLARVVYRGWFRTECTGGEHLPSEGAGLVVGNHAGALWALDSLMTATAVQSVTRDRRYLRMLGADVVFRTPLLGNLARRVGATAATPSDTARLLESGELVGVWPEGFRGIGKPYRERYQLRSFGRGGFVIAALRAGAPIVPTAIVGAEEIYPKLGEVPAVAKLLGLPYFPLTPTFPWLGPLGLVPLPTKWYIDFGDPIDTSRYGPEGADDPLLVSELTDRVRRQVQAGVDRRLARRRTPWY